MNQSLPQQRQLNNISENLIAQDSSYIDIDSNLSRERINFLSINSSRELFAHFSVLFISYMERMEIQNNNPF